MKTELLIVGVLLILYGFVLVLRAPGRSDESARHFSAGMGCGVVMTVLMLMCIASIGWILER